MGSGCTRQNSPVQNEEEELDDEILEFVRNRSFNTDIVFDDIRDELDLINESIKTPISLEELSEKIHRADFLISVLTTFDTWGKTEP